MYVSFIGKVLDNYRILERLGIGGMGVVFKAIHIKLDKVFAIKVIAPGLSMNEHFIKRFQTEAKALAKFEDPNIVRIYDLRSVEDQWFIVMEFVQGVTLTDKILKDGAFHWLEALPIIKQVLSAIGHAHESGIIHRDIKPNNIMITDKGVVKITDFGLAKDQTNAFYTVSITSGGTLYYMSPEHVKGASFIDARSDLYSIGMTFYEMLTGVVPFQNIKSDFDIRETIVRKEFTRPRSLNPSIPAELEMIVIKSISKNPDDRYQTADEMLQALRNFEEKYDLTTNEPADKGAAPPAEAPVRIEPAGKDETPLPQEAAESFITRRKFPLLKLAGAALILIISLLILFKGKFSGGNPPPAAKSGNETPQSQIAVSNTQPPALPVQIKISDETAPKNSDQISTYSNPAKRTGLPGLPAAPKEKPTEQVQIDPDTPALKDKNPEAGAIKADSIKPNIDLPAGGSTPIAATAAGGEGSLSIQVRPWGSIYINNKLYKSSADIKYTVKLAAGQYDVRVVHPTLGIWQKPVQVKGDNETGVIINFTRELPVEIRAVDEQNNTAGGDIYIDGKRIEQTMPAQIPLRIGLHKISVKKDGYTTEGGEKEILVDEDSGRSLAFTLKKEN